jgi:hypothetical protein
MKPPEFGQAEWFFFNLEKVGRDFTLSGKEFHNFIVEGKFNMPGDCSIDIYSLDVTKLVKN